jgi:hypothetical protein
MSSSSRVAAPITLLDMIISDEQVRLALRDLHNTDSSGEASPAVVLADVPAELVRRVADSLAEMPEMRPDRVARARADLAEGRFTAQEVAGKIIGRVISDSLR